MYLKLSVNVVVPLTVISISLWLLSPNMNAYGASIAERSSAHEEMTNFGGLVLGYIEAEIMIKEH